MAVTRSAKERQRHRRQIKLKCPHRAQRDVLRADARFKVWAAGRRTGKTTGGLNACLAGHGPVDKAGMPKFRGALQGAQIWWVVPELPTSGRARWRELKAATYGAWTYKNEVERRIEFPGGGSIEVRTASDPDSLRGEGLDGVVLDEAPLMAETAWTEALRPAIADKQGWAMFLSTPKGRANWFFGIYCQGADDAELARLGVEEPVRRPGWKCWRHHSRANPLMTEPEIDDMRFDLGALRFAQEVEADFVVAGGNVFKREWFRYYDVTENGRFVVIEADTPRRVATRSLTRWATVDLAVSSKTTGDYTVIATVAVTDHGELLLLDLVRAHLEGPDLVPALRSSWRKHHHAFIAVESTAFQLSIVQAARRAGLPVRELKAAGETGQRADKVARALHLAARMEGGMFFLPRNASWLPVVETELEAFSGLQAEHDDIVDALSYAAIEQARDADRMLHTE